MNSFKYTFLASSVAAAAMMAACSTGSAPAASAAPEQRMVRPDKTDADTLKKYTAARQLFNEGKYTEYIKASDALLESNALSGSEILGLRELRIISFDRLGDYAAAAAEADCRANDPALPPASYSGVKMQAASYLMRAGKDGESEAYCLALLKDGKFLPKGDVYNLLIQLNNRKRNFKSSDAYYDAWFAFESDAAKKANVRISQADLRYGSLNDKKSAYEILEAVMDDASLPDDPRLNAFGRYAGFVNQDRADKTDLFRRADVLLKLRKANPFVYAGAVDRMVQIRKSWTGDEKVKQEAIRSLANMLLDYPDMVNEGRISGAWILAEQAAYAGDWTKAEKILRDCLAFPKLSQNEAIRIYTHIGRLHFWRKDCDKAVAAYRELLTKFNDDAAHYRVADLSAKMYSNFFRFEEAAKCYMDVNRPAGAARVWLKIDPKKAKAIAKTVLEDENALPEDRATVFGIFSTDTDPASLELCKKYIAAFSNGFQKGKTTPNANFNPYWYLSPYENSYLLNNFERDEAKLASVSFTKEFRTNFDYARKYAATLVSLRKFDEASKFISECLAEKDAVFTPAQKFEFALYAAIRPNAGEKEFASALAMRGNVSNNDVTKALIQAGRAALNAREENTAMYLAKVYDGMLVPLPQKTFQVPYFETPVGNITDFLALKNKPAFQLMDRAFGGSLEFLVTDVSTGNRGEGIGSESGKKKPFTKFWVVCDAKALHFVFFVQDDKLSDIQAKTRAGGGFEMYLAPGPNTPYTCFMPNPPFEGPNLWHTTYNNEFQHRIDKDKDIRWDSTFADNGYYYHMAVAWTPFFDKLPDAANKYWDFENIGWSQVGGFSWNGTKSIHGRSTWGRLAFDLAPEQLAAIKKNIIFDSVAPYNSEKYTTHQKNGVLSFWQDPVLGDVEFYNSELVPLVKNLDSYLPLVKAGMSDADVNKVYSEALPGWRNLRYIVDQKRAEYLEKQLSE